MLRSSSGFPFPSWFAVSSWKGKRIVLSVEDLPAVVISNMAGNVSGNAWKAGLTELLDDDDDGIEVEEIRAFIEQNDDLKDDAQVQQCLDTAIKEGGNILHHFEPVKDKLKRAAAMKDGEDGLADDVVHPNSDWAQHLSLLEGWQDYDGIKVRPETDGYGIDAISALSNVPIVKQAATLMGELLEPLMKFGYEPGKNLVAFPYDWRCAVSKLEQRDQYFSKTMKGIEELHAKAGEKVVICAHSMGCRVAHYFLLWVTDSKYGQSKGGKDWLDKHIHSFMPIGGPFLGASSGTSQYLQPGDCSGLAPAVVSFTDGHGMIRSWGSMPLLFGSGKNLMMSAGSHYIYTRREGALLVEVTRAKCPSIASGDKCFVRLGVSDVKEMETDKQEGGNPDFSEIFQFAWEDDTERIENRSLTIKLFDDNMVVDKSIGEATIRFDSAGGGVPASQVQELTDSTVIAAKPWEEMRLQGVRIGESSKLWLSIRWVPSNAPLPAEFDPGEGKPGCGGTRDAGTSELKRAALQKAGIDEWKPTGPREYDPRSTEMMFALEDMVPSYKVWQELYANDNIFSKMTQGAAPAIQLCQPIYGTNKQTQMGMIFRRKMGKWKQGRRTNFFEYDHDARVEHPGYICKKGLVYEKPNECPQASEPDGLKFGDSFVSGDLTVPHWSLRWPVSWAKSDVNVNIVEVEGGTHRGILGMPAAHWAVLQHVAAVPDLTFHVDALHVTPEARARSIAPPDTDAAAHPEKAAPADAAAKAEAQHVFVEFNFGNSTRTSSTVPLSKCDGSPGLFGDDGKKANVTYDPDKGLRGCTLSLMLTSGLGGLGKGTLYPGSKPQTITVIRMS